MSDPKHASGSGLPVPYAEKYNEEQIETLYERPPFGEPTFLHNELVVGAAGVGKTHLLRKLATRLSGREYLPIYADLQEQGVSFLAGSLPLKRTKFLFPQNEEHMKAGIAALTRCILMGFIDAARRANLSVDKVAEELSQTVGLDASKLTLQNLHHERVQFIADLRAGLPLNTFCAGALPDSFATISEALSHAISNNLRIRPVFLLDSFDWVPILLQEQVVDVLRRESTGVYLIATRPFPSAPYDIEFLQQRRKEDFAIFNASYEVTSIDKRAEFLAHVATKLAKRFTLPSLVPDMSSLQRIAWISGNSTRVAIQILLAANEVQGSQTDKIREAINQITIPEVQNLGAMGQMYQSQIEQILKRWTHKVESATNDTPFGKVTVHLDSPPKFPELSESLRIMFRENMLEYLNGQTWQSGVIPITFGLNPLLLAGKRLLNFTEHNAETLVISESTVKLSGIFNIKRPAVRSTKGPRKAKIFVSCKLDAIEEALARKTPLVSLLETKSKDYLEIIVGATITGIMLEEIETRIRESNLIVADLTDLRPDVLVELGIAIASKLPAIFVAANAQAAERVPNAIRTTYGVASYEDSIDEITRRLFEKLQKKSQRDKWIKGLDGAILKPPTSSNHILCINPNNSKNADHIIGHIKTTIAPFSANVSVMRPTGTESNLEQMIRRIHEAMLTLIELPQNDDPEYFFYSLTAAGIAYGKRKRTVDAKRKIDSLPILYSADPQQAKLSVLLQQLVITSPALEDALTVRILNHFDHVTKPKVGYGGVEL